MRVHHLRLEAKRRFKGEARALSLTRARERDAKIEMSQRQAMKQTDGA